jgi:hypothetical protein
MPYRHKATSWQLHVIAVRLFFNSGWRLCFTVPFVKRHTACTKVYKYCQKQCLCYFIMTPKPNLQLLKFVPSHKKVSCCWTTCKWQRFPLMANMACNVIMQHATWKWRQSKYLRVHGHCCQFNKDVLTGCISIIARDRLRWRHLCFLKKSAVGYYVLV